MKQEIIERALLEVAEEYLTRYGEYVMGYRAFPDYRDGLKPVHRACTWSMYKLGLSAPGSGTVKAAKVVGDIIGSYHPHGDCLHANTLIVLANGERVRIKDLVGKGYKWVWSYNEKTKLVEPALASKWRIGQVTTKMYTITLSNGKKIRCTGNHPLLTEDDTWVKAEHLTAGAYLAGGYIRENGHYDVVNTHSYQYEPLHRVTGRYVHGEIASDEVYHHKNEDTLDNRPNNMAVMGKVKHAEHHYDYKGYSFEDLVDLHNAGGLPPIDTTHLKGLTKGLSKKQIKLASKKSKRTPCEYWNGMTPALGLAISDVFRSMARFDSWEHYEEVAAVIGSKSKYNRPKTLWHNAERLKRKFDVETPQELESLLGPNYHLRVVDVQIKTLEKPKKFYDFTVKGNANLLIDLGDGSTAIVHNSAAYGALVGMSQTGLNFPIVFGQGNWGSAQGDEAAAPRYTECKLTKYGAQCLTNRLALESTEMMDNYDGTTKMPVYLPALLPNLLLNGTSGIGVGATTNVPGFEADGVFKLALMAIQGKEITPKMCLQYLELRGVYGGYCIGTDEDLLEAYATGRGVFQVMVDRKVDVNKRTYTITGIHNRFNWQNFAEKLAEDPDVQSVDDESSGDDLKFVVVGKGRCDFKKLAKKLDKMCTSSIPLAFNVVNRGLPKEEDSEAELDVDFKLLNFPQFFRVWARYRIRLQEEMTYSALESHDFEVEKLDMLLLAIANLEALSKVVKAKHASRDHLNQAVCKLLKIKKPAADYILSLTLYRLSSLEKDAVLAKRAEHMATIAKLEKDLKDLPGATVKSMRELSGLILEG